MEKQSELLNTQLNVNTSDKSTSSNHYERHDIPGTPWHYVETPDKTWLAMGNFKMSPDFKNIQETEKWVNNNMIKILATMSGIIAEKVYHDNEAAKELTKKGPVIISKPEDLPGFTDPRKEALIDLTNEKQEVNPLQSELFRRDPIAETKKEIIRNSL